VEKWMERSLENITLWAVWYEDRFGTGPDRDPASLVALFVERDVAERYIDTHEGPIDVKSGKFDGLFMQEWEAKALVEANLIDELNVRKLLSLAPPARLLSHWEKGWTE
jgi:hypothetical protein